MNRTPATAATRLGPRKAGVGAASGSARSRNLFPVGGKEKRSKLDDAWYRKDDEIEYEHIMAVLDRDGGFGQNPSDPAFYVHFPTLKERRAARDKVTKKMPQLRGGCPFRSRLPQTLHECISSNQS